MTSMENQEPKKRKDTYTTGLAAEHLIMSCLTRLGLEVYLTMGNRKKTDIRVFDPDTNTALSVDVKAVRGYSSLIVDNLTPTPGHVAVFVVFNERLENPTYMPDIYIVPSEEVPPITENFSGRLRVMKTSLLPYKEKWETLKPNYKK
jgi:hypothetical protein